MTTALFFKLPQALAARRDLTATDKLVYAVIQNRMGGNDNCWPGIRRLSEDCGFKNIKTALAAVKRLERAGLIEVLRSETKGRVNHYRLTESVPKNGTLQKTERSKKRTRSVPKNGYEALQKTDTNKNKGKDKRKDKERARDLVSLPRACGVELPAILDTPAFREAWQEWQTHRRDVKKPLTATTAKRQLAMLVEHGAEAAVAMIMQSIERGWMGLFELKEHRGAGAQRHQDADAMSARGQPVSLWRADGSWDHAAEAALINAMTRDPTPEELALIEELS